MLYLCPSLSAHGDAKTVAEAGEDVQRTRVRPQPDPRLARPLRPPHPRLRHLRRLRRQVCQLPFPSPLSSP